MAHESVQPRQKIRVKEYRFLCFFLKFMSRNIIKSINRKLSGRCSKKHLDNAKQTAIDTLIMPEKEQFE